MEISKGIADRPGVTKLGGGYNFSICTNSTEAELILFKKEYTQPDYEIHMSEDYSLGNVFSVFIKGINLDRYKYIYKIDGRYITDPYSVLLCDVPGYGKKREIITSRVAMDRYDWEDDRPLTVPSDELILYKLHVRGFTKSNNSKVANKGTFKGVANKIPYLQELGINAIELMPAYEFDETVLYSPDDMTNMYKRTDVGALNYWGYQSGMYFIPKASYSSCHGRKEDYTTEFKDMVKELHKAGIIIVMEMFFDNNADPVMVRECLLSWIRNYHVDGFHLICSEEVRNILVRDQYLKKTRLFYDYWNEVRNADRPGFRRNLFDYNDGFMEYARRFLKGDEDQIQGFLERSRFNPLSKGTVNYIANNNGFTLMDMVCYDRKHNEDNGENNKDGRDYNYSWNCGTEGHTRKRKINELRFKQIKNIVTLLFVSQGIPMIYAGDEFGNSQEGNNNPYCQDNRISWLNWNDLERNKAIYRFFKQIIEFRKQHKVLHLNRPVNLMDYKAYGLPDLSYHGTKAWYPELVNYSRHVGMMYCGKYGNSDNNVYIAINMHWEKHSLALPNIKGRVWRVALCTGSRPVIDNSKNSMSVQVMERSVVILVDEEAVV